MTHGRAPQDSDYCEWLDEPGESRALPWGALLGGAAAALGGLVWLIV